MAPVQQAPEIQFAQRLASNEKPTRTKAIKKLRKFIRVKSQRIEGGLSSDELLKLWKGLFYCLWMQDKPLLQEELSNQIAGLLHSFQNVDSQFLYLETFLQTMKREWTGIDRHRMDKFFQLVRFVFRQAFEMLKRKEWDTSLVAKFLELLTAQVLQRTSEAPCGLQLHILDLYMTELAVVGSAQLSAEQNLTFIEPFCKSAAKTKDRVLLRAICSSVFSAILDQAPFAIEDLMKEMKTSGAGDSDSGQASEEEEKEEEVQKTKRKLAGKKTPRKQMNGTTTAVEEDEDEQDEEDDELLHLEDDSDREFPDDGEMGPVLQFDYGALADKLFGLASRGSTPSLNRQKLYKVIKALRDLSEGVFPQDDYPEEVSTDEDDEMFASRKRIKRRRGPGEEVEGGPAAKKAKGKKGEALKPGKSDEGKPADDTSDATNKKKKKKKKKKKGKKVEEKSGDVEEQTKPEEGSEVKASAAVSDTAPATASQTAECEKTDLEKIEPSLLDSANEQMEISPSEASEAVTSTETQSGSPQPTTIVVGSQSSVTLTEAADEPEPLVTEGNQEDQSEKSGLNTEECEPSAEVAKAAGDQTAPGTHNEEAGEGAEPERVPETDTATTADAKEDGTKSNEQQELEEKTADVEAEGPVAELTSTTSAEETPTEDATAPPLKKSKKKAKQEVMTQEEGAKMEAESPVAELTSTTNAEEPPLEDATAPRLKKSKKKKAKQEVMTQEEGAKIEAEGPVAELTSTTNPEEPPTEDATAPRLKKSKKKKAKQEVMTQEEGAKLEAEGPVAELTSTTNAEETPLEDATAPPLKKSKKKKAKQEVTTQKEGAEMEVTPLETSEEDATPADESPADATPLKKPKVSKAKKPAAEEEAESQSGADATGAEEQVTTATPLKKTRRKKAMQEVETTQEGGAEVEVTSVEVSEETAADPPPANESPADDAPLIKKKKPKVSKIRDESAETDARSQPDSDAARTEEQVTTATPIKKKKKKRSPASEEEKVESQTQPEVEESCEDNDRPAGNELPAPLKTGKKKRKIPVVIEVEAEELEAAENCLARCCGKKPKMTKEPATSVSSKKKQKTLKVKKDKAGSGGDFVSFQSGAGVPTPLFFKTKGGHSTPVSSKKKSQSKSESKKVTFGLKNNKTAEFRKNDRSLLVSPEGSSRVPFDPQQKPLFGVLKSPTSSPICSTKKKMVKNPFKGRPTAADFF